MKRRNRKLLPLLVLLLVCALCVWHLPAAAETAQAGFTDEEPAGNPEEPGGNDDPEGGENQPGNNDPEGGENQPGNNDPEGGENQPGNNDPEGGGNQPGNNDPEGGGNQPGNNDPENGGKPSGGENTGGFPGGGFHGGFGGRGGRGGRGGGGNQNTPGKALISTHASGSGNYMPYGAVKLTTDGAAMQVLTLGGEELALSCGGHEFTASVEEDVLVLRAEDGDEWSLTMNVLKTLNTSGIRELRLIGSSGETALDTGLELSGTLYGKERAKGYVSADFLLVRQQGEWIVRVDEREYRLSGNELAG